jgi:hypothetical protein
MRFLLLPFSPRYILLSTAFAGAAAFGAHAWRDPGSLPYVLLPLAFFGFFAVLGVRDLTQRKHAILRNYPIAAHLRFILEHIRPELRQYFFESDTVLGLGIQHLGHELRLDLGQRYPRPQQGCQARRLCPRYR